MAELMNSMTLGEILRSNYAGVGDESIALLQECARLRRVKRREYIVRQDVRADSIYFISEGLFRGMRVIDGVEDTLFFGMAGDPFTSAHSLAHGEAAQISMQAIMDSQVYEVPFDDFRRLLAERRDLMAWWSAVLLEQVYALERRYVAIGTSNAEQRYETFLRIRSEIIRHIPLKYIAQYLNVTPETLSRIRRRIVRRTGR